MLLVILMMKNLSECFTKDIAKKKKKNQKEFSVEKVIKRKALNYMLNGKNAIIV